MHLLLPTGAAVSLTQQVLHLLVLQVIGVVQSLMQQAPHLLALLAIGVDLY